MVESYQIEAKAKKTMERLYKKTEQNMSEYLRELNSEIGLIAKIKSGKFEVSEITDTRRIARWGVGAISGAVSIAGIIVSGGGIVVAGVAIGLVGVFFDWLTDSRESKAANARANLEGQLRKYTEKLAKSLKSQMINNFEHQLIKNNIERVVSDMKMFVSALFSLADTQRNLADVMLQRQLELNHTLLSEALSFLGMSQYMKGIVKVGRLPGFAVVLLLDGKTTMPDNLKRELGQLLGERVIYAIDTNNNYSIIRQLLKRKLGENLRINLEEKIRVAHVRNINELDEEGRQLCVLSQQLTGFHVIE